jgi:uncharacterized protein (DUF983 family)
MEFLKIKRHVTKDMMKKLRRSPGLIYDCPKCETGKPLKAFARGTMKCTKCEDVYKVPS